MISVITPAYNAEAFLSEAIESLLNQTAPNWELIIIDDGSADATYTIATEYAQKDPRIKVATQKNAGPAAARNHGIALASGDWVTFLDADDMLEPHAIEIFNNSISSSNSDIYVYSHHDGWKYIPQTINRNDYIEASICQLYCTVPICKLFRRELFDHNTFNIPSDIRSAEDWIMNVRLAINLQTSATFCKEIIYIYRPDTNPNSLMKTYNGGDGYHNRLLKLIVESIPDAERPQYAGQIAKVLADLIHHSYRKAWKLPSEARNCYVYNTMMEMKRLSGVHFDLLTELELWTKNPMLRFLLDMNERVCGVIKRKFFPPKHKYYSSR